MKMSVWDPSANRNGRVTGGASGPSGLQGLEPCVRGSSMDDARAFGVGIPRFPKIYRPVRWLGRGGVTIAFEVQHLPTGERRVAKLLPEAALLDAKLARRMQREAQVLRRLRHPNVVRVLDWGELENGHPFLVLEYLDGATVAEEVRRRSITLGDALAWASQTLSALGAAHAAGLVHRDVSPENLVVCAGPEGRAVKVCDFGFAKVLDAKVLSGKLAAVTAEDDTEEYAVVGSPFYVSPEAVRAEPLDARADLYQVGLVLYTMLTGYVPFSELEDTVSVLGARLHTELPPVAELRGSSVPPSLEGVLRKALAPYPSDRFSTAQEFMAALAELDGGVGDAGVDHGLATLRDTFSEEGSFGVAQEGAREWLDARDEPRASAVEAAIEQWLANLDAGGQPAR